MCAAPGGKALAIIQTLYPRLVVANDNKRARVKRIEEAIAQFLSNIVESQKMVVITERDGRRIDEKDVYNKVRIVIFPIICLIFEHPNSSICLDFS